MKPVKTPATNKTFKLIGGTDENDLPLEATEDSGGQPCLRSTWEPTDEERKMIALGSKIELTVWGRGTPPVMLGVEGVDPA